MGRVVDLKTKKEIQEAPEEKEPISVEEIELLPEIKAENEESKSDIAIVEKMQYIPDSLETISWNGSLLHNQPDMRFIVGTSVVLFAFGIVSWFLQKSFIASMFFVLFGAIILIRAKKPIKNTTFTVSPLGITIGNTTYNFRNIASFWIAYDPRDQIKELSLHVKYWYMPYIKIPIDELNPVHLRQILIKFIPEIEHEETLLEVLARKIGL